MTIRTITPIAFSAEVLDIVGQQDASSVTYLDAIDTVCKRHGLECDVVPKLMTRELRKLVTEEAMTLNLIKKTAAPDTGSGRRRRLR